MGSIDPFVDFGEAQLVVAGLRLWVHGWEREQSIDFDDANWLRVTMHCSANGSSVWADGAVLQTMDIERFSRNCARLLRAESERAQLDPHEPTLKVVIERTDRVGHLRARVDLTADPLLQSHSIAFEIDQSHLPSIIAGCESILRTYPVRGTRSPSG